MSEVTVRDLRNNGAEVLERVTRGESITVTRDGKPVAELRPVSRKPLSAALVLKRWQTLPKIDPDRLKAEIDHIFDATL